MLNNLNIRTRLLLGFGTIILYLIIVGGFLLYGMNSTYMSSQDAIVQQSEELLMAEVQFFSTQGHLWFEEFMGGDTTESVAECYELWKMSHHRCGLLMEGGRYEGKTYSAVQNPTVRKEVESARTLLLQLVEIARARAASLNNGALSEAAGSSADQQFDDVYTKIMQAMERSREIQTELVQRQLESTIADYNAKRTVTFVLFAIAIAFGVVVVRLISRRIIRPIRELDAAAHSIVQGNWSHTITVESNDELGALAWSFNAMAEHLRLSDEHAKQYLAQKVAELLRFAERFAEGDLTARTEEDGNDEIAQLGRGFNSAIEQIGSVFSHLAEASETTAHTTGQIRSVVRQVADMASELSIRITDMSASVEEIAYTIAENASNAGQTATTVETSGELARRGGVQVQQTLDQMRVITEIMQQSVATVEKLGDSGAQIGEIILVINDIADQTNLLALNAAIEAARAGEHGRGFAVVADEVRKLADRTSKATGEIGRMIKQIQEETSAAVVVMKKSEAEVRQGMDVAGRAGSELQEIIEGSLQVKSMVGRIAIASQEQSQAAHTIAAGIEAVTVKTSETSIAIQHIVPMIDELNDVTSVLQQYVEQFTFAND